MPNLADRLVPSDPTPVSLFSPGPSLAGRWDIYGPVHKGLRMAHGEMLIRLGCADWAGEDQEALITDLRSHLAIAGQHLAHEDRHIHPALASRAPASVEALEDQHDHHRGRFVRIEGLIDALSVSDHRDRADLGRALYQAFGGLVAEDLTHMLYEETVVWPALCEHFTDAELKAMEMEIIAALSPGEVIGFMRLMIPAMSHPERVALLGGMKADAPAEAYDAVIKSVQPDLDSGAWTRLQSDLGRT